MARDRGAARANPPVNDINCKSCSRILATVSPQGDLVLTRTQNDACDTCRQFEELHDDVEAKDDAFRALEDRRFEHAGRLKALEEQKAAKMAFDNFRIQIEAPPTSDASKQEQGQSTERDTEDVKFQPQGQKRPLTLASPSMLSPRPSKRPQLDDTSRRVSFDDSVVFRDESERRPEQAFNRGSEEYVPGRNAPSQGISYLDTSGLGTTATRFFGVKKQKGKGWVLTKEGKELDEQWRMQLEKGTQAAVSTEDQASRDTNGVQKPNWQSAEERYGAIETHKGGHDISYHEQVLFDVPIQTATNGEGGSPADPQDLPSEAELDLREQSHDHSAALYQHDSRSREANDEEHGEQILDGDRPQPQITRGSQEGDKQETNEALQTPCFAPDEAVKEDASKRETSPESDNEAKEKIPP